MALHENFWQLDFQSSTSVLSLSTSHPPSSSASGGALPCLRLSFQASRRLPSPPPRFFSTTLWLPSAQKLLSSSSTSTPMQGRVRGILGRNSFDPKTITCYMHGLIMYIACLITFPQFYRIQYDGCPISEIKLETVN